MKRLAEKWEIWDEEKEAVKPETETKRSKVEIIGRYCSLAQAALNFSGRIFL